MQLLKKHPMRPFKRYGWNSLLSSKKISFAVLSFVDIIRLIDF